MRHRCLVRQLLVVAKGGDVDEQWRAYRAASKKAPPRCESSGRRPPDPTRPAFRCSALTHPSDPVSSTLTPPPPCCRIRKLGGGDWNAGQPAADNVRRQERLLLDVWTRPQSLLVAASGTLVLLLVLLVASGGPPSDPRCTLPWC